ncbi:hypothetical protein K402DRAFT_395905 [Aulographum hederae CBS 113979]|uniref:SnoaL-like domain-containing protein n=1 Tax=Aulographum hederae CBS 113979 TaxID=1176131 RepID=A0A6G1GTV9_9PEZI|nr:hypothetical protein K402DRAFT_395905 [Aulographum hederae CBS 113979]
MRPFPPTYLTKTFKPPLTSTILSKPTTTIPLKSRAMSSSPSIETTDINTASGVSLSSTQQTLVGSVLDLFAGKPTKEKLALWKDDAKFEDPLTKAEGRKQFEAQWYGLPAAFNPIKPLSHTVTSAGNPITMDLKTLYTVKGIGKEQTINSVVNIFTSEDGKITKVEDKWDGKLPEGAFSNAMRQLNSVVVPKVVGVPKE